MSNDNLFNQTYNQIVAGAFGGGQQNFQLLGSPQDFIFGIPQPGQTPSQAYLLANSIPNWSPVGTFGTADATFVSAYKQVLQNVTYKPSPSQQNALQELLSQKNEANQNLARAQAQANSNYNVAKANGGAIFAAQYPTVQDWLNGPGAAFAADVEKATQQFTDVSNQYNAMYQAAHPKTLENAQTALIPPTSNPADGVPPQGWTIVQDQSGVNRFEPAFNIGTTGEDIRAKLSTGTIGQFTVNIDASDTTSKITKSWAGAQGGYDAFFWGVEASGGWEKLDIADNDKSLKATVSVKSSTLVQISPDQNWYDSGFMRQLAKGSGPDGTGWVINPPWVAKGAKGSSSLFGQYGLLSARVSGLLVAYQPSFSLTMSESTYQKNYQKIEAGGGLRIGPFHFGGHGGHESTYTHETNNKDTFTGGSTSTDPLIIGVTVAFPGVDAP